MESGTVLAERNWSWVWRTCLAMAGEEITTVVIWPSLSVMIGPWDLARFARDLCGLWPRDRRLPMSGRDLGPGGSAL